ncbi:MAG: tyrosine-type recombinase/integrase [Pseudomonadota bacterium]
MDYKLVKRTTGSDKWYIYGREDGKQKWRSTGTADKASAERILAKFVAERSRPGSRPTVGLILRKHIQSLHEREARSLEKIVSHLGIVDKDLGSYEPEDLNSIVMEGVRRNWRQAGTASGTMRTRLQHLRAALNYAEREGWIDRAPYIQLTKPGEPRTRYLSREEFIKVYAATKTPHLRTFLIIAVYTGMRSSAILSLKWDQINRKTGVIIPEGGTANKRRVPVPINTTLAIALSTAWLMRNGPYVVHWRGKQIESVKKAFRKVREESGVDHFTIHDLRRTCASWLAEADTSMEKIAAILGDSVEITERHYARLSPSYLKGVTDVLD